MYVVYSILKKIFNMVVQIDMNRKFGKSANSHHLSNLQRERQPIWSTSCMPLLRDDLCFTFHGRTCMPLFIHNYLSPLCMA